MSSLVFTEIKKLKRKKTFLFALVMALVFPALGTILIAKGNSANFASMNSFIREESGFLLLMPVLVLIAVHAFFLEYDNNTMKNLLVLPISKKEMIVSKLVVLLIFSIVFQSLGFAVGLLMSFVFQIPVENLALNFALSLGTAVLLWAAALPCITFLVWLDKSYLLSVIVVFIYTLVNYMMHLSETVLMQEIGFNLASLMPVPLIFRWLYQFNTPTGPIQREFFNRFSPYFIPTSLCFALMLIGAFIFILLMIKIYEHREI